jgi:hypothetical protein
MSDQHHLRPMPLAEADQCCGQIRETENGNGDVFCANCPLIIERIRAADAANEFLPLARAL